MRQPWTCQEMFTPTRFIRKINPGNLPSGNLPFALDYIRVPSPPPNLLGAISALVAFLDGKCRTISEYLFCQNLNISIKCKSKVSYHNFHLQSSVSVQNKYSVFIPSDCKKALLPTSVNKSTRKKQNIEGRHSTTATTVVLDKVN